MQASDETNGAAGNAYMDNTPQEQMQEERLNRIESKNRTVDVDTNLARFKVHSDEQHRPLKHRCGGLACLRA